MKRLKWVKHAKEHDSTVTLHLKNAENHVAQICKLSMGINVAIKSLNMHKPTLEDVFLHYTGRNIREEEATSKDAMRLNVRMWRRR
jgi:ABC-2 type transport system ATP-binding protein